MSHKPKKAINKAFLKQRPTKEHFETFKTELTKLLADTDKSKFEEFNKNVLSGFLKHSYYHPSHFINTKERNDLVIHNGKEVNSSVGVIIETKSPSNKSEMMSRENPNTKAFHELILYFLRERITHHNNEVKHLIATNSYEWFVFDATWFEKTFAENKTLVKDFKSFEEKRLSGTHTEFFYNEIAKPFLANLEAPIEFTYFDLRDYKSKLETEKAEGRKLIELYKVLSPEHLLKLPFANDSNSLDKKFYTELLHIMGLEEWKDGGKKLIGRKKKEDREEGSIIENTIVRLDAHDIPTRWAEATQYGDTREERLYNIALELCIIWMNRILFLKLLEGQLLSYHKGDKEYAFLNSKKIKNYDDLDSLFFQVLARKADERGEQTQREFSKVPYLNSSLFETTDIEHQTAFISNLKDDRELTLFSGTVLKNQNGKRQTGKMNGLHYLFAFLDAYDFGSESSDVVLDDNKSLINASVLGLIFEKINGYKDGSFFTPGFITMYMCRETIRRAVVQKFNETKGWKLKEYGELYNKIEDSQEANTIINSLRICDPAVGSGHFLVSALNEIIAIKHDLKILADQQGKRLKEYQIEVVNDELVVTDEDGDWVEYNPRNKESQRVQEALFHEKETIIENCLFGVDINPNSVKICRLRLWIELLKNAYYKNENELETLPNIDINIKCGNSLISRFGLDTDLKEALRKSKWNITSYKLAVSTYRNAESKEQKREMEALIADIKSNFRSEISQNDPKVKKLYKLSGELTVLMTQTSMFGMEAKAKKVWTDKVDKLTTETKKLETEIEEIKNNKIYQNAFEWRFEFPEVLNDQGDFVGFDVVIGNPPYIRQEELSAIKPYLQANYKTYAGTADLFVYFIELGLKSLKKEGEFIFIVPNKWMRAGYGKALREFIQQKRINGISDFGDLPVFEEATTYPCILSMTNSHAGASFNAAIIETLNFNVGLADYIEKHNMTILQAELPKEGWTLVDAKQQLLLKKLRTKGVPLGEYVDGQIFRGVLTGLNEAFVIDNDTRNNLIKEDPNSADIIKPFLAGRDIKRYQNPKSDKYLILIKSGETKSWFGDLKESEAWKKLCEKFPSVCSFLKQFESKAKKRYDKGNFWWELRACDYYQEFEKSKIMLPDISLRCEALLDEDQNFYSVNTAYVIPDMSKSDLGILNSKLTLYFYSNLTQTIRGGYYRFIKQYLEQIPFIKTSILGGKVNQILSLKKENPETDTSVLEAEIDQMVYDLYGLTPEEIKIVEEGVR
ncbi:MAG: Eco57I restriction-modification methylase domain-containing protein [Flavobacteriales bacterium]|nr:Eco57I restriction-modification methylase domain-containing protein [Flavobacteriales bacterium]